MSNRIYFGDNLPILQAMPAASVDLIYIDPPFNTGKVQGRTQIKTARSQEGDRTGSAVGATKRSRSAPDPMPTCSMTIWHSLNRAWRRRIASWRRTAACTSTSTIAKYTTARCCWTPFSAATAS